MPLRAGSPGSSLPESTKLRIVKEVTANPGQTGREIANRLGLERSTVNSFLYSEGREMHGLAVRNWRWSSGYMSRRPTTHTPPNPPAPPDRTICGNLAQLSLTQATIKIRTLSLEIVELAFAEDEYNLLDDRLKAELSIRRTELLKLAPITKASSGPSPVIWLLIIIGGLWFATTMSNQPRTPAGNTSPGYSQQK